MSASREKQRRIDHRGQEDTKTIGDNKRKVAVIIISVVLALLVLTMILLGSGILHNSTSVIKIGGTSVSPIEYNYYFTVMKSNIYNTYYQYGIAFDTTTSLKDQSYPFDSTQTWLDFINNETLYEVATLYQQYNQAVKAGAQLTDEDRNNITAALDNIRAAAASATGNYTMNSYLVAVYGAGMKESVLTKILERQYLASRWASDHWDTYTYTDDEVQSYYEENRTDYDLVSYHSLSFDGNLSEGDDDQKAAYTAAVKKLAEEFSSKVTTAAAFPELALEYHEKYDALTAEYLPADEDEEEDEDAHDHDDFTTEYLDITHSSISITDAQDWLYDSARKTGDKTMIESDSKFVVYSFLERGPETGFFDVDVRHILISFDAASTTPTDEEKAAALEKAQEVYDEWLAGDKGEDSFGELAAEYTDDGNGDAGGLYENVKRGTMVTTFNDWIFDDLRQPGDTDIVETSYGYHIMYFVGGHGVYWQEAIRSTRANADFESYITENADDVKYGSFGLYISNLNK